MKLHTLLFTLALALLASTTESLAAPATAWSKVIPNQYIVTLKASTNLSQFSRALQSEIARERALATGRNDSAVPEFGHQISIGSSYKAVVGVLTQDMVEKLKTNSQVAHVEPDFTLRPFETTQLNPPNWGLSRISRRTGSQGGYYFPDKQGQGVDIYVIDSGIRLDHEEFAGDRAQFLFNADDSWPSGDIQGHGTHIAGIAAGSAHGVAKRARVHSVKVFNDGGDSSWSAIVRGMQAAYNSIRATGKTGVCVISSGAENVGWDGPDRAVEALFQGGCVVVKAAGDSSKDACSFTPARTPQGLTVATLADRDQSLAYYSNFGGCVQIAAPGTDIASASNHGGYMTRSGSSFAAPHVAGAAALVLGQEPWLKPQEVVDWILSRASQGAIRGDLKGTPNRVVYVRE